MSEIILVANKVTGLTKKAGMDYIGVDGGSVYCMNHALPMVCAIGDFDSINESELRRLKEYTKVIQLPVEKDMVDSEYAISYAHQLGYDKIILYGATGGRLDHFITVFQLLKMGSVPFVIKDENNIIYRLEKGDYVLKKRMKYLSFFACEPLHISVKGVKYPLQNRFITEKDVYLVSNEILDQQAELKISGKIIVIESDTL